MVAIARLFYIRYDSLEAFEAGKRIERELAGRLPNWVQRISFEALEDISGELSLFIWVLLDEEFGESEQFLPEAEAVHATIERAADDADIGLYPYIRFTSTTHPRATY